MKFCCRWIVINDIFIRIWVQTSNSPVTKMVSLPLCMTLLECMCSKALQSCTKYFQMVFSGISRLFFLKCWFIEGEGNWTGRDVNHLKLYSYSICAKSNIRSRWQITVMTFCFPTSVANYGLRRIHICALKGKYHFLRICLRKLVVICLFVGKG